MGNTIREIVAEANKNKGIDKSIFGHKTELELTNGILASNIKELIVKTINENKTLDKNTLCHKIEIELVNGVLANNVHILMDDISVLYEEVLNLLAEISEETPITEEV